MTASEAAQLGPKKGGEEQAREVCRRHGFQLLAPSEQRWIGPDTWDAGHCPTELVGAVGVWRGDGGKVPELWIPRSTAQRPPRWARAPSYRETTAVRNSTCTTCAHRCAFRSPTRVPVTSGRCRAISGA
eukprot:7122476-Prymnesium_polylepis.1